MKFILIYIVLVIFAGIFLASCSDLESNLPPAPTIHFHGDGSLNPMSSQFHGKLVADKGLYECRQCHGADFSGGITTVSCKSSNCHPSIDVHKLGIIDTTSANFHGRFMASINWNILDCAKCHNSDFSGGIASPSCLSCHTEENGPEACNTCHGDPNPGGHIFPPRDLEGDTTTTDPGVGAHVAHLVNNHLTSEIRCSNCHKFPSNFFDPAHISPDGLPAQIIFGQRAILDNDSTATFDYSAYTCSNTYCHGNFVAYKDTSQYDFEYNDSVVVNGKSAMMGNNKTVIWNQVDGTQAKCGSCHGLPPLGHRYQTWPSSCVICHRGVIDDLGNIIDSTKHINGVVNVFGN